MDKYGILAPVHKRVGGGSIAQIQDQPMSIEQQFKSLIKPAVTTGNFDELPAEFYEKQMSVSMFTTISQRHANPEFQTYKTVELYPMNKYYISKEAKRCNTCEHNVLKPESNITSIKYKLHQMAM